MARSVGQSACDSLHEQRANLRLAQMVGRSFRCGMLAQRENAAVSWSYAWQEIAGVTGPGHADRLVVAMGAFVDSVQTTTARRIDVLPKGCPGFCRDECLAISIIAASQLGTCPALKACIFALLESGNIEPCVLSAERFGAALREAGQTLPPDVVCNALALMPNAGGRMRADA